MQKLSSTKLGVFIPCLITVVFIAMLLVKNFHNMTVAYSDAICLGIPASVGIIFYITKFEKGLKWVTDVYTYSLAVALVNALLFVPIAKLNGTLDKILYITNYNDIDITSSFAGLAGIPEVVWGLFLTAFAVLPIIYLAFSGRRK